MAPGDHAARPWVPRWLLVIVGVTLTGYAVYQLRGVLTPLFVAMMLAYLLDPVVDWLEKRRIPRGLAIAALLGAFLLVALIVFLLVVPMAVREVVDFFRQLPHRVDATWRRMEPWLTAQGVIVPGSLNELRDQLGANVGDVSQRLATGAGNAVTWLALSTASVVSAIVTALMIPVLAFYLLYDFDRMRTAAVDLVPWRYRPLMLEIARDIDAVIAQFIRGQLVVMAMLAVAYSGAYSAVGVPLAVPIGLLAGLASFIPYLGGGLALGTALFSCALTGTTWLQIVLVVAVHFAIQLTEGFVITPRIMSDQVGLPAIWVILALLGFGELFGFLGVVIAVPAAAVIKTLLTRAVGLYRQSEAYGSPPNEGEVEPVPALDPECVATAVSQRTRPPPNPVAEAIVADAARAAADAPRAAAEEPAVSSAGASRDDDPRDGG